MFTSIERGLKTCLALGCGVFVACAVTPVLRSAPRPERTQIARAEVLQVSGRVTNAYDLVLTLRPAMLVIRDRTRLMSPGISTPNDSPGIRVYVDRVSVGGVDYLRTLPREIVLLVEWLSPIDATSRYGAGHMAGVIDVTTRPP